MRCVILLAAAMFLSTAAAYGASTLADGVEELKNADHLDVTEIEVRIVGELEAFEDALIEIVSEGGDPTKPGQDESGKGWTENQEAAIHLLARLRSEKAIPVLARKIHYTKSDPIIARMTLSANFPATGALIAIGRPSVPFLLDNIARSPDPLVRKVSALAIVGIEEGEAPRELRRFLRYHRGKPSEARIKEALEIISEPAARFRRGPAYLEPIRWLIELLTDYSAIVPETLRAFRLACAAENDAPAVSAPQSAAGITRKMRLPV